MAGGQTRSTLYAAGVDDRGNVKGKWRKGGDRDLMRGDSSKRRRSSGWFKRLASSFQTNQASSASEELREGVPSLLHGALPSLLHGAAEHDDSGGDNGNERWISSTAPAMMSSATISSGRPQSEGDGVRNEDGGRNGDAPTPKDRGADFGTVGTSSLTDAGFLEFVAESARRAAREKREGGDVVTRAGNNGAEAQAEMEGETSDYETGSGTTEGFGSDDAGDLWEGERRSTLMEPLGRTSFMPNDDGMRGEIEMKDNVSGIGAGGEGNSGKVASTANAAGGQADGGETMPGTQAGEVEALGVEALIEEGAKTESRVTVPALDVDSFVTATKAAEAESSPNSTGGAEHGDSDDHADRESNVGQGERGLNDYSSAPPSCAEGAKVADISTPVAKPRLSHFGNVSPSRAPPSVLPATLPETVKKEDGKEEDPLPPVAVEEHTPSPFAKFGSSPAISDGNSPKESPRAWRLSWWARASERHPPSAPVGNGGNEEADGGTGTSFAAALNAAAGGEEAVAAALSAGGAFAPSCHAGDAPAVVDSGDKMTSAEKTDRSAVAAVAAGVDVARRARRRSMRRRREKPWLSKDQLTDTQVRPLEAASEYLDVAGLARSGAVCRAWRRPLSGEEGRRRWMRCVRLPEGVPDMWRAKFYLHILYDQPSWVQQVGGGVGSPVPSDADSVCYCCRNVMAVPSTSKVMLRVYVRCRTRESCVCISLFTHTCRHAIFLFALPGAILALIWQVLYHQVMPQRSCTQVAVLYFVLNIEIGDITAAPQLDSICLTYDTVGPVLSLPSTPCCFGAQYHLPVGGARLKSVHPINFDHDATPAPPSQAHGSTSTERPRPGVYQGCLAKARDDQEETRVSDTQYRIPVRRAISRHFLVRRSCCSSTMKPRPFSCPPVAQPPLS